MRKSNLLMWRLMWVLLLGSWSFTSALPADLDPSFGTGGRQFVNTGAFHPPLWGKVNAVGLQSDGKIILAGQTELDYSLPVHALLRLNTDGSLDTSFGENGYARSPFAVMSAACLVIQSDDKIVVTGVLPTPGSTYDTDIAVARFLRNGSLDTRFDGDGIFQKNIKDAYGYNVRSLGRAIVVQQDGKIVVAGTAAYGVLGVTHAVFAALRLNVNGTIDTAFGEAGVARATVSNQQYQNYINDMAVQADGKIIVAGTSKIYDQTPRATLVRFNSDGTPDTSFSGDGILKLNASGDTSFMQSIQGVAVQSDGKIVVAGPATENSEARRELFAVARLKSNGGWDTSFSSDGKVLLPIGSWSGYLLDLALQSDSKILLCGLGANPRDDNFEDDFVEGFAVARLNSDGSPDVTFDGDGQTIVYVPVYYTYAQAMAVQSDGKIVVAGHSQFNDRNTIGVLRLENDGSLDTGFHQGHLEQLESQPYSEMCSDMALQSDGKIVLVGSNFEAVRLNTDGSLDNSFGSGGKVRVKVGVYGGTSHAVAVQGDGKIIIAGTASARSVAGFAVVRLNADGSLDNSFHDNGKLILVNAYSSAVAYDVAVARDGKILLAGSSPRSGYGNAFAVARLNANGTIDASFGEEGWAYAFVGSFTGRFNVAYALALQSDGKIVVVGARYGNLIGVARFRTDGSLDSSFDGDGELALPSLGYNDEAKAVAIQGDGKIVVAGSYSVPTPTLARDTAHGSQFALLRLNPNGTFDNSFDGDGKATFAFSGLRAYAQDLAIQKNGQIVVAGVVVGSSTSDFGIARVNPNGSPDNSFNGDGTMVLPMGESNSYASAVALQRDGKIVVAGYTSPPSYDNDFAIARLTGTVVPEIVIKNPRAFHEGNPGTAGSTTFNISLNAATDQRVTVEYRTTDGTAKAGEDYIAKSGIVIFEPGQTRKAISVPFIGDSVAELNETFFLDLKLAVNALIVDSRGIAYIGNDDGPSIFIDNARAVAEGQNGFTSQHFTVRLSAASTNTITVDWATANNTAGPADYVVANGRMSFAPGETSKTITVQVKGDTLVEPNETYRVNLTRPTFAIIADSQGIGYIINDDSAPASLGRAAPSQ